MQTSEDPQTTISMADHNLSLQFVTMSTEFRLFREEMRDKLKPLDSLDARVKTIENELQIVNLPLLKQEHNEMYDQLKASNFMRRSVVSRAELWGGVVVTIAAIVETIFYFNQLHK